MRLNIVLVEPEIPSNTGNISRTCSVIDASLHLVHPLGFDISEKAVRRAGLDYWDTLDLHEYKNINEVIEKYPDGDFYFCTTKGKITYSDVDYKNNGGKDIFLVFGKETKGLPEDFLEAHRDSCIRIPMRSEARSLNLSNAVAITVFEALRQLDFPHLQDFGKMKSQ
jgi:tRNA (cytidine/uridine-2'-O-)-methyltransferase